MTHRPIGIVATLLSIAVSVMGAGRIVEIPTSTSKTPSDPTLMASLDLSQLINGWLPLRIDPNPIGDAERIIPAFGISASIILRQSILRGSTPARPIQGDDDDAPALAMLCRFLT